MLALTKLLTLQLSRHLFWHTAYAMKGSHYLISNYNLGAQPMCCLSLTAVVPAMWTLRKNSETKRKIDLFSSW